MSTIFTKIWKKEIPSYTIAENDQFYAFLDINPLAKGHTLVIPKVEVDYIFDLKDDLYQNLWLFAKGVATKIERVVPCKRIGVAVIGLEVPHTHIHLVPINNVSDIDFSRPKLTFSPEELAQIAGQIRQA